MEITQTNFAPELLRLTRRCRGIDKYVAAGAGLSVDEMHCVIALYTDRPSSVSRLSELISVSPSRASKLLKALEHRKLVTRTLDPADHRREVVILTPPGTQAVEAIFATVVDVGRELIGTLRLEPGTDFSWLLQAAGRRRKEGAHA